jgi:hypothetical protein
MTVIVRRLEHAQHEYFAYAKSICGRATYFLYFTDDILGAVALHNFVEMLRRFFERETINIKLQEPAIQLKNEYLMTILRSARSEQSVAANHCSDSRTDCPPPSGQTILTGSAT